MRGDQPSARSHALQSAHVLALITANRRTGDGLRRGAGGQLDDELDPARTCECSIRTHASLRKYQASMAYASPEGSNVASSIPRSTSATARACEGGT